jgi:mono/diheme cytochrome c family protein
MTRFAAIAALSAAALVACSHAKTSTTRPTAASQIAEGGKLFAEHCAGCHGPAGEGTDKAPPVIGKGALPFRAPPTAKKRTARFRTAKDVASFVVNSMPADDPGSLTVDQYLAILAFDLNANGVDLGGRHLDMAGVEDIVIHP